MRSSWLLCALGALSSGVVAQTYPNNTNSDEGSNESYDEGYIAQQTVVVDDSDYNILACDQTCTVRETTIIRETVYDISWTTTTETKTDTEWRTTTTTDTVLTTSVVPTTEWTTTTTTFETSYPVVSTTVVECVPYDAEPTEYLESGELEERQCNEGCPPPPPSCGIITVTSWTTTTATEVTTVPTTVPTTTTTTTTTTVPTTIPTTIPETILDPTTIPTTVEVTDTVTTVETEWSETTFTTTSTVTTSYPVTITEDTTQTVTSVTTTVETVVSTVVSSVPVEVTRTIVPDPATITRPGETVTQPGETRTRPGETRTQPADTVTQPGETITLPGQVTTLPGSTVTTTITEDGEVVTTTLVIPPITTTAPGDTIVVTPLFDVSLCPAPTGNSAPLDPKSNLTFGCSPGRVCNPPKPQGCNFWPEPPRDDFLCEPADCIISPPFNNVTWPEGETSYYPPSYGYFDLNPNAFGLSYDIFEYQIYEQVEDDTTITVTTGNWESQVSLSTWPLPTTATTEPAKRSSYLDRVRRDISKRDVSTPAVCYAACNDAYKVALAVGKSDSLCAEDSTFQDAYAACTTCVADRGNTTKEDAIREYVEPEFDQFLNFCGGRAAEPTETPTTAPESIATGDPDVSSTSQADTSSVSFETIPTTTVTETETEATTTELESATSTVEETTEISSEATESLSESATSTLTTVDTTSEPSETSSEFLDTSVSSEISEPTESSQSVSTPGPSLPTPPVIPSGTGSLLPNGTIPTVVPTAAASHLSGMTFGFSATLLSILAAFFA